MDLAQFKTINNEEKSRFELNLEDGLVLIDYKIGKSGSWNDLDSNFFNDFQCLSDDLMACPFPL